MTRLNLSVTSLSLLVVASAACDGSGPGGPSAFTTPRWTVEVGSRTLAIPVRADADRAYASGPGGLAAFAAGTGERLWLTDGTQSLVGRDYAVASGVVAMVELEGGELTGLDARNGATLWHRTGVPTEGLVASGDAFFASDGETTLAAYDAATGVDLWRAEIEAGGFVELYAADDFVCAERLQSPPSDAIVQCFDRSDGENRWTREIAHPQPRIAIAGDRIVVSGSELPESGEWMALDAATGETVWRAPGISAQGLTVSPDGTRVFGCGAGCLALRLSDGAELWRRLEPEETNAPVAAETVLWVTDNPGLGLWAIDAATGAVLRQGRESDDVSARGFCGQPAIGGANVYVFRCGGFLFAYESRPGAN